jgi:hypothetical protein
MLLYRIGWKELASGASAGFCDRSVFIVHVVEVHQTNAFQPAKSIPLL